MQISAAPTQTDARIQSLDVVRGVALLGILLMNIIGMGMLSSAYFHPLGGLAGAGTSVLDQRLWVVSELLFEGSMRALFSMLFGAGVVLFTTTKSGALHYGRTFWLFCFGLLDAYLLLWSGDILLVYALAGALLYFARQASVRRLVALAVILLVLLGLVRAVSVYGLGETKAAHERVAAAAIAGTAADPEDVRFAADWSEFAADVLKPETAQRAEIEARRGGYSQAFAWNAGVVTNTLLFVVPVFMFWDALLLMIIGMALYRLRILQGDRSERFYLLLAACGIGFGLCINSYELNQALGSGYAILSTFGYIQPTYDLGRLGLALGYMALIIWWLKKGFAREMLKRLAAVGRMALTNYLMHSLIALFLFTGAGLALVGHFDRLQLYAIVLGIWVFQLWFSPWWLKRHPQGPMEALWRRLTYGRDITG